MIGYLRGEISFFVDQETLVLDCKGVGYQLQILTSFIGLYHEKTDSEREFFIHTHQSENELRLFAFNTLKEKLCFEKLIKVSGVGPKLAMKILDRYRPNEVAEMIETNQAEALQKGVSGLGKKIAGVLAVKLQGKMDDFLASDENFSLSTISSSKKQDLISAMMAMGFKESDVTKFLKTEQFQGIDPDNEEEQIRYLISELRSF